MEQHATASLGWRTFKGSAGFLLVLALFLFVPAWSLAYWQGWVVVAHFAFWMLVQSAYFLKYDRQLMARRLRAGPAAEREPVQKRIQLAASIIVCALFTVAALDHRFGWSSASTATVRAAVVGNLIIAAGFSGIFFVFRENSFASSIVEVGAGQTVIDTGPYALVRHPMYAAALLLFAGVPPALGSWWGLVLIPPLAAVLVLRLRSEEAVLARGLGGYSDYCRRVHFRLVPGVW